MRALRPGRPCHTVSWPCPGRVAACTRPCHGLVASVSLRARCRVPARTLQCRCAHAAVSLRTRCRVVRLPSITTQVCIATQLPAPRCVAHLPGSVAAPARPCRDLSRDTTQQPSLRLSRYNRLYRDTLPSDQASLLS